MKVYILTCASRGIASLCLERLVESSAIQVVGVVYSKNSGPKNKIKKARRAIKKVIRIGLVGAYFARVMSRWRPRNIPDIVEVCDRLDVPLFKVEFINTAETMKIVSSLGSELGLSLGNSYISESIFGIPPKGMLNVHMEILPNYQNGPSVVWPIFDGLNRTGFSIHKVDSKIDTGRLLHVEFVDILFRKRLKDTIIETRNEAMNLLPRTLLHVLENFERYTEKAVVQVDQNQFSSPTMLQLAKIFRNNLRAAQRSKS